MYKSNFAFVECGALHRGTPHNCICECLVFDINMLLKKNNDMTGRYLLPISKHTSGINYLHLPENNFLSATVMALFYTMKNKDDFYD